MLSYDSEMGSGSLYAKVLSSLKEDILNGELKAGESLIESKVSEQLGVSRTPVREAIRQLESEGLVEYIQNKGAVIKGISHKDTLDIFTIRMKIEGLAAKWAAEKITNKEIEEMKEYIELEEFYTAKKDSIRLMKMDTKFHNIIFKASKSGPLMHMLNSFHHFLQLARASSLEVPIRAEEALNEHKAIMNAIIEKDPDKAEKLMNNHVKKARNNYIKIMNN